MKGIVEIIESFRGLDLQGEDDEALELETGQPASEEELESRESTWGLRIPTELRELLLYTNGVELFGNEILAANALDGFPKQGLIVFHEWGNGDFDAVATSPSRYSEGAVVFVNHSPDVTVRITDSLSDWLLRAVDEIGKQSALLHPMDYRNKPSEGLYAHVLDELRGIDCESNR